MNTRILVPLDGSPLSEQALPAVKKFASGMACCSIELFYVIEPATLAFPADVIPPANYLTRAQVWASEYLAEQATSLTSPTVDVQQRVGIGPPARAILDYIRANSFDYVFMATHGRSGLARAVVGSVTDRVIREATIPVIAVHPKPIAPAEDPWPGDNAATAELISMFARADLLSTRAVDVLTQRGAAAVPELVNALSDDTAEVRQYAARTLGAIATGQLAVEALVSRLSDEVWEVRWDAEEALVQFGEAGVQAVLESLVHAAPDARRHQAVLHVLEKAPMGLWEMLKPVLQALRSRDGALSTPITAAKALQRLRQSALTTVS
jgi:nucleotide-binding universal stress UspA family protein